MPICFVPDGARGKGEEEARDAGRALSHQAAHPATPKHEWREPPGYLGEAVRRAKRIASGSAEPPEPQAR